MNKHLRQLEDESIYIIREVYSSFRCPVLLYSIGKDSGVLSRLCWKSFYPAKIPFPLMHIDTGVKFREMYDFRRWYCNEYGFELIIYRNEEWIGKCDPYKVGTDRCCIHLKTEALLQGIKKYGFDCAIGGARREEEKSRAKERVFSVRDESGRWEPRNQRPELWDLYNSYLEEGQTMRVFPLSNWTEIDIWEYILEEKIPVVSLYYAKDRKVKERNGLLIADEHGEIVRCRYRSLGCYPCTGAIRSEADTIKKIIEELRMVQKSERENRLIDLGSESSMEEKKRDGYF